MPDNFRFYWQNVRQCNRLSLAAQRCVLLFVAYVCTVKM